MISAEDRKRLAYLGLWAIPLIMPPMGLAERASMTLAEVAGEALRTLYRTTLTRLEIAGGNLTAGRISAQEFAEEVSDVLSRAYREAAEAGKAASGRARPLSAVDLEEINKLWTGEKKYVDGLTAEYASGKLSEAKFAQRLQMYPGALTEVFNRAWAYHLRTETFSWRMHPAAQHCVACISAFVGHGRGLLSGQYRLEELPFFPGRSPVCLDNCMCHLETASGKRSAPAVREPAAKRGEQPSKEETSNG